MPLLVEDWVNSIQDNPTIDALSQLDELVDNSIGFFGLKTETIYGDTRQVPLFEFRSLPAVVTTGMAQFVGNVEQAVISYHSQYASRRLMARAESGSCPDGFFAVYTNGNTSTGLDGKDTTRFQVTAHKSLAALSQSSYASNSLSTPAVGSLSSFTTLIQPSYTSNGLSKRIVDTVPSLTSS